MKNSLEPVITAVKTNGKRLKIEMSSGLDLEFDSQHLTELQGRDVSSVKISRDGNDLIFGADETVVSITSVVVQLVGEKSISSEMSRRRGSVKTKAKTEAARDNGKLGGRPLKAGADEKRRQRYLEQKAKKAEEK